MAVWPGTLPVIPLVADFTEAPPDVLIRTQMDAGPVRVRPRYTAGVRPITGKIACTKTQVATLDTFFVTTLAFGSLPFDWTNGRTGATVSYRFVKPPTYKPESKDLWMVTLELEVMP